MPTKEEIITGYLATDEGTQRLAHVMSGSTEPFMYIPRPENWREMATANYLRRMAALPETSPNAAQFYLRLAESWEAHMRLPRWKQWLLDVLHRFRR